MGDVKSEESLCESCGEPLFLSKEECREFLAERMKQGFMVCKCCGAKQIIEQKKDHER